MMMPQSPDDLDKTLIHRRQNLFPANSGHFGISGKCPKYIGNNGGRLFVLRFPYIGNIWTLRTNCFSEVVCFG